MNGPLAKKEQIVLEALKAYIDQHVLKFEGISEERKVDLLELSNYMNEKLGAGKKIDLTFICTHNSRRSHFSQIWAQTAASFYGIPGVHCHSGGTEVSAFNPRAIKAMQKAGFNIIKTDESENPIYQVSYSNTEQPIKAFSKTFSDEVNPKVEFAAIMTCSDADEACPFVPGADARISTPYPDPKLTDDTPDEELTYDQRCMQIASEMFYVFSNISY